MGPGIELEKRRLSISGERRSLSHMNLHRRRAGPLKWSKVTLAYSRVGSGYKTRVQQDLFVVPDRVSSKVDDRAARFFKNALGRGGVPLHRGANARINIGSTFSNETKLERTAHDYWLATFRLVYEVAESFLLRSMVPTD